MALDYSKILQSINLKIELIRWRMLRSSLRFQNFINYKTDYMIQKGSKQVNVKYFKILCIAALLGLRQPHVITGKFHK